MPKHEHSLIVLSFLKFLSVEVFSIIWCNILVFAKNAINMLPFMLTLTIKGHLITRFTKF